MKLITSIFLFFLFSCTKEKLITNLSFYHWKTDFNLSKSQNETLTKLGVKKIYVKYFDIKYINSKAVPIAEVNWKTIPQQTIVPVVYITTSVFSNLDSTKIIDLAKHTAIKINTLHPQQGFTEIQFDCDWTPSVKNKYFYFLTEIKTHFENIIISSTLRLYQYKYPKIAGVPPVDKCTLMYYNMGELYKINEPNSILNNKIGKQYLGFNEYPKPIDIALPNFSWALVFRNSKFEKITTHFSKDNYKNEFLFEHDTLNKYWIIKDTVINNYYYRYGDNIRFESPSEIELKKAITLLTPEINQTETSIVFYDLNTNITQDYEKINSIYNAFK